MDSTVGTGNPSVTTSHSARRALRPRLRIARHQGTDPLLDLDIREESSSCMPARNALCIPQGHLECMVHADSYAKGDFSGIAAWPEVRQQQAQDGDDRPFIRPTFLQKSSGSIHIRPLIL
ncbi:hypothetical protein [Streptomyces virginiae]|uniref:hypothetical protein n=1 Tax=Streptomyces virginiae TaxID=1961 RepID=UPI00225B5558|nr:hypothetical protein [Streptomyces virginiae]MCX5274648.1 hypothetical protein [Streptomyces virginiae]